MSETYPREKLSAGETSKEEISPGEASEEKIADKDNLPQGDRAAQECREGREGWSMEQQRQSRQKKRSQAYGKKEFLLAVILLTAAWVYMRGVMYLPGIWLPVFTALYLAAGCLYLCLSGRRMSGEGFFYMMLTAVTAFWFLIKYLPGQADWEYQYLVPYVTLFLHSAGVYWVLTIAGNRVNGRLDECGPWDLARGYITIPFGHFGRLFGAAAEGCRRMREATRDKLRLPERSESDVSGKKKNSGTHTLAGQILLGITFSVPVLLIVLPMLAAADDSFRRFTGSLASWCAGLADAFFGLFTFGEFLWNLQILLTACYLFGLFYGAFHAKPPKKPGKTALPRAVLLTFAAMICGVYLLFFLVKFADVSGILFAGQRDIVYSSYARQGFFELCLIAVINFGLFYFIKVLTDLGQKGIRPALTVLGIETLGFIVLAFSKMSLYISVYGFTFKRVFTSWFMGVLFFTFTLLVGNVWRKGNAIRLSVWFASITFLLLAYSNMEVWMDYLNLCLGLGVH